MYQRTPSRVSSAHVSGGPIRNESTGTVLHVHAPSTVPRVKRSEYTSMLGAATPARVLHCTAQRGVQLRTLTEWWWRTDSLVMVAILSATLLVGIQTYNPVGAIWDILEYIILGIFVCEVSTSHAPPAAALSMLCTGEVCSHRVSVKQGP